MEEKINVNKTSEIDAIAIWCSEKGIKYSEFQRLEFFKAVKVRHNKYGAYVHILNNNKLDWLLGGK